MWIGQIFPSLSCKLLPVGTEVEGARGRKHVLKLGL